MILSVSVVTSFILLATRITISCGDFECFHVFFPSSFLTVQIYKTIFKENQPTVSRFMKLLLLIMILLLFSNKVRLFCNLMDCSPPGSSDHGISQAGRLEWVAISSSRRSSQPRDPTQVSHSAGRLCHLSHQDVYETLPSELPGCLCT